MKEQNERDAEQATDEMIRTRGVPHRNDLRDIFLIARKGFVPASDVDNLVKKINHVRKETADAIAEAREAARKEERERCVKLIRNNWPVGLAPAFLDAILNRE